MKVKYKQISSSELVIGKQYYDVEPLNCELKDVVILEYVGKVDNHVDFKHIAGSTCYCEDEKGLISFRQKANFWTIK